MRKHNAFLNRIVHDAQGNQSLNPVAPLTAYRTAAYRRVGDPVGRPYEVFQLRKDDGSFFSYPEKKLIHIAGMIRHLAVKILERSLPPDVETDWLETYVAGHAPNGAVRHRRFSYLPLPSIGHVHADQSVRRVMIVAPMGDDHLLKHLAIRLSGQQLEPTEETAMESPPVLHRVFADSIASQYVRPSTTWTSVTPVILPGHDDHKSQKTRKLIEAALRQSGIEQHCNYDWSPVSRFPKSLSAHKYDRDGRPAGYIRPDHLLTQTAIHLTLRFQSVAVPGPLMIGAGRHYGLGLMAGVDSEKEPSA
jgi:CRISPR-associated protein Csb2